jgi:hypothetical protein
MPVAVWREVGDDLRPFVDDREVIWAPQDGSQEAFLSCPIFEVGYFGTRGPGKTDALLMDFGQDVGKGWGAEWRGILFRRTFPELQDVVSKTLKWFSMIWPEAVFTESPQPRWRWPTGEELLMRQIDKPKDYYKYHGHAYPWISFEELTNWPNDQCYKVMMSCSRSTMPGMPRKFRATGNPYGVGHNWVKKRFRLPPPPSTPMHGPIISDEETGLERVAILGNLFENRVLLHADPDYPKKIAAAARNESEKRAWLFGDWDITSGGMFDDLWDSKIHVIQNLALDQIPREWRLDRSYDHGQSAPFAVLWWAESNGEPVYVDGRPIGAVRGDIILVAEWYGWNGTENVGVRMGGDDIAVGIREREIDWNIWHRCLPAAADSSIFDDYKPGKSVAGDMRKEGILWEMADKSSGSRKHGWEQLRKLLRGALPSDTGPREKPGLFICERCEQTRRTFPGLSRADADPDDVDSDEEDHIGDAMRYRVRAPRKNVTYGSWK